MSGARAAGADEVAIFGSASEGFSRANINASIEESLARFAPVVEAAKADGVPVRGYVSCVVECPYDGRSRRGRWRGWPARLRDLGCYEISLGDTIGRLPGGVDAMLSRCWTRFRRSNWRGISTTRSGRALDNIEVALARGLRVFDAAVGGLGGCPYAPGAAGNVATEAVAERLRRWAMTPGSTWT
jgi:hydroxymethylglutaryl-CoA lyase